MAKRGRTTISRPAAIVDPESIIHNNGGRQVDWENIPDSFVVGVTTVIVNDASATKGDTSITVQPLSKTLGLGSCIHFGKLGLVTVTVSGAGAAAAATSIPVNPLTGPIPAGTILDFAGAGEFALLTAPAAQGDLSLTVEALPQAIAAGKVATFPGGELMVTLSAVALQGATTIWVEALPLSIPNGAKGTVDPDSGTSTGKQIPPFTVMSELASGMMIPRSAAWGQPACGIIETYADENSFSDAASGYGVIIGGVFYENLLPDADSITGLIPSVYKTELDALGIGFAWYQFEDNRTA